MRAVPVSTSPSVVRRESAASPPAPEFEFAVRDFERVRTLIRERAGIDLQAGKHAMMYSRLSRRLRETGHRNATSYLESLERNAASGEWQQFVNCPTTNRTAFFREEHHFDMLAAELKAHGRTPIRIWCNAASTGEEPYSLAMTCIETLGAHPSVNIVATDVDTDVLAVGSAGVYSADARGLTQSRLHAHFLRGKGANAGHIRVKRQVAQLIEFAPLNLMDAVYSLGPSCDIVFCRNVLMYFDAATQRKVLEKVHAVMKRGALLFVGHAENLSESRDLFRLRSKTVYERCTS
jgi:chemotaxis protein methyltransferase CheR